MNTRKNNEIADGDLQAHRPCDSRRDPDGFDRQYLIVRRELAPFQDGVDPRISGEQLDGLARRIVSALRLEGFV
jgi:hypothetical protein